MTAAAPAPSAKPTGGLRPVFYQCNALRRSRRLPRLERRAARQQQRSPISALRDTRGEGTPDCVRNRARSAPQMGLQQLARQARRPGKVR
eukprot:scaffold63079_cov26-Tisochrysis_lutea.AAC.3